MAASEDIFWGEEGEREDGDGWLFEGKGREGKVVSSSESSKREGDRSIHCFPASSFLSTTSNEVFSFESRGRLVDHSPGYVLPASSEHDLPFVSTQAGKEDGGRRC